jgi:hypothetical protein
LANRRLEYANTKGMIGPQLKGCAQNNPLFRMARISLPITLETHEGSIFQICDSAGVRGKEANEVYHSLDAVRVWRDRFEHLHGDFLGCIHCSNPDDPPDLVLNFSNEVVEAEHTRLEPAHYGWMGDLQRKECPDQCIFVPSVSLVPQTRTELLADMLLPEKVALDTRSELHESLRFCLGVMRKKIEIRAGGLLVIQVNPLMFGYLKPMAELVHSLLSPQPNLIRGWTILLHCRRGSVESYLIAPNEKLQCRTNERPPL